MELPTAIRESLETLAAHGELRARTVIGYMPDFGLAWTAELDESGRYKAGAARRLTLEEYEAWRLWLQRMAMQRGDALEVLQFDVIDPDATHH